MPHPSTELSSRINSSRPKGLLTTVINSEKWEVDVAILKFGLIVRELILWRSYNSTLYF